MALINLGQLATDVRNSIGGVTYSRNKGGAYARAKVSPVQPRSAAQMVVRNNFAANSKAWSGTLTAAQRAAWTFFAAANPLTNVFGNSIIVSGLAMYMKLNQVLSQIGSANISDPPPDLSVPAGLPIISLTCVGGIITFNTAAQSVLADFAWYVFSTPILAAGKTPGTSDYRYIQTTPPAASALDVDMTAAWTALFGAVPTGVPMYGLIATVNTATGAVTPGLKFSTITV